MTPPRWDCHATPVTADVTAYYDAHGATVHHGDCVEVMRELPDSSVDAVALPTLFDEDVTDG